MTSLKTAQEIRGLIETINAPAGSGLFQDEIDRFVPIAQKLIAQYHTDLLDSIEEGMGGERKLKKDDAVTYTMMDEGYNTAHRKFLAVIKEHRV